MVIVTMFGQFTNPRLDQCAYGDRIAQSVKPSLYALNPIQHTHCDQCVGRNVHGNELGDRVSIESLLKGIGMPLSNDRCTPYVDLSNIQTAAVRDCNFNQSNSRLDQSARDLRGTISSRLDHPLFDHQSQALSMRPTDTRREAKDNHRAIWDEPFEQTNTVNFGHKRLPEKRLRCQWESI